MSPFKLVVRIEPDDGGLVDAEHVLIAATLQNGAALDEVKKRLRVCARPAKLRKIDG